MLSSLTRIASCYTSEYDPKLVVIASFLPSIKQGLNFLRKHFEAHVGVSGLDGEALQGIIDVCCDYIDVLFAVDHPELINAEPYRLTTSTENIESHFDMLREEQNVYSELLNLTEEDRGKLPGLKERYERLIDYFSNYDNPDMRYTDIELTAHIAYCIAAWRKVDIGYALKTIEPHARELLDFEPAESTQLGAIYSIQSTLTYISEIYAYVKDAAKEYECHIKYLKLGNVYLKRMCFEHGIDYFLENTKQEYVFYHYVLASAAQIAQEHKFKVDELYFELCKRKNIFYLGEMWQRQGSSATGITELLKKDFSFDDLNAAIPADSMLIDFFYIRALYDKNKEIDEELIESRVNSTCIAFSMAAECNVKIHFVSDGLKLAEYMRSADEFVPYFKWVTKRLLDGADDISRIIVCTEGDMNQLSFAALPHLDGYVTDRYSVRNIASVFNIVYPHAKKEITNALIVFAPNFGDTGEQKPKWPPLDIGGLEGGFLTEIFIKENAVATEYITGNDATAENIRSRLIAWPYGAVHISTHGYFKDGRAYIVTAGANGDDNGTAIPDSDFTGFSLESTAIATYALCFGAKQSLALQDSLSGLIKESLLAGANTIIAPTASIPDLAAAIFMSEFYRRYLNVYKIESAEDTLKGTIAAIRNMCREELLEKYCIEVKEEYPFADVRNWGNWICFSAEEMR
jgi:hypothetical protein